MLSLLRSAAGTWVAKGLLSLLVVSFAVWGISGQLHQGFGAGQYVLTAGGTQVSPNEFRLAYDRQLSVMSQQLGQRLTRDQARTFGVDQQVLSQLLAGAVLDEQARAMRLGLSKDELATLTREDPAFHGPDGQFNRQQFDYVLRQVGMRPEDYLKSRGQAAIRQQIIQAVSDGLKVPDVFLKAVALYRGEDRTADYIVLAPTLVQPVGDPAADVLAKWFDGETKNYAAPEFRKLSYLKLSPDDIADATSIGDDQVKADYDKNKSKYATPETRTVEQIVFKSPDAAKAARDSIRSGSSFENIVQGEGKTLADVQLGTLTKDKIPDPAVADAAFKLKSGEVSEVVAGGFGPVLVRVTAVTPEHLRPFDEVKDEIRKDLALGEANRMLFDVHDKYEDARAGGDSMKEAADRLKLKIVTIDAIDRSARKPDGSVVNDLPDSQELLRSAFDTEVNAENPALNLSPDGFLFYEVGAITPARDRTLDEVHDKVVADWKAAETKSRLAGKAADVEKQVKDGTPLDKIAAELKLDKQTKRGLKREADDSDIGKSGIAAVFSVPQGGSGTVAAPDDQSQIVFKVTEADEPVGAGPDSVPDDAKRSFGSGMSNDLLEQLVARLQGEYPVSVDQAAIDRALAY